MTTLAVTSVNSLLCHAPTCFRIGSKFRCMRSTPTEMQSMSENDFECFASTGVNTPATMRAVPARHPRVPLRDCVHLDRTTHLDLIELYQEITRQTVLYRIVVLSRGDG